MRLRSPLATLKLRTELWHIQLFARWESRVVLRYVREAPLATSHLLAARMAAGAHASQDAARPQVKMDADLLKETEAIKDQHAKQITQEVAAIRATGSVCRPLFVFSTKCHHSRAKLHRPRDDHTTHCGWEWASAFARGTAVTLDRLQKEALLCGLCERLH